MVDTFVLTVLSGFAVVLAILALAKRSIPITPDDAEVIWTMHRKTSRCNHIEWQFIKRRENKIVGFKCACGYQYKQKRPLLSRMPTPLEYQQPS